MRTERLRKVSGLHPQNRQLLNGLVTIGSAFLCLLILPTRIPGMVLLGISPNWLLVWVVTWSIKRTMLQGAAAGVVLGLIQDGMTHSHPTHAIALGLVGLLTARLQKQRYIQEDFISVALIVFGMAIFAETVTAIQFTFMGLSSLEEIWAQHRLIALSSAILSSLWAPVVYFPLNRWWESLRSIDQS